MKNSSILMTIIVVVVVAGGAFFGGMQYEKSKSSQSMTASATGQGQNGTRRGAGARAGGATVGQVESMDSNSLTVQLQDGSSKIINLTSTTTYAKTASASSSDVKKGDRVGVFGTSNSDGSVTAQNVQLNPMFGRRGQTGR